MDKILLILLSLLVGFIILLIQFFFQSGGLKAIKLANTSPYYRPTFLICGPNNAGKTALFYKLISNGEVVTTVSSIEPNFADISLPIASPQVGKKYQLIDYPGHLKYWNLFEKLILQDITLPQIKGVCVVLDSSSPNWSKDSLQVEKISKFLFNLLAITERKQNGVDYLFAVNKSDLFDSLPVHKIRSILEVEINRLIENEISSTEKTSGIDISNDDENEGDNMSGMGSGSVSHRENLREFWLGVIGSAKDATFTFDKLEGNMDFLNGSVLKDKIEKWEDWLDEKVVNP
ncbi:hypothetical protein KGF56_004901 [Candida oxycetoniae]|uniref:Signal recognition particle receptor subunit beta n=1 Tax=Candida oxycetoniae TaxID=497107 RepID=A0AAI9WVU1_9ASCO|nr:uncharacterized protein KGF56_004901 [Candida oxycetoniae]KAI3402331.1 hypothetical protein KGF56_004901 [Candida oxycetoniae]